jgi:hypothetical protein
MFPWPNEQRQGGDSMTIDAACVFISYRRRDSHIVGRLYDRLVEDLGEARVFLDVDSIRPGEDYSDAISRAVAQCGLMLVLIGHQWGSRSHGGAAMSEVDHVRLEVEAAFDREIPIIPVLLEDASMPRRADLPETLTKLSHLQAIRLRYESFKSDAAALVAVVQEVVAAYEKEVSPRATIGRLFRPENVELQIELENREAQLRAQTAQLEKQIDLENRETQLRAQTAQLEKQQAQLRQQAIRLRELADFQLRSDIAGGVFISYSHEDKDVVDALTDRFAMDQINYWLDEKDLFVGDELDKAISKGIQESLLFIIVLTPTSISSKWVDRELDEAAHEETEGRKIILPIIAKDLAPNQIPARLRRKLYVDISRSFDDGYAKLTRSIRHHLRTQGPQSSPAY